MLWFFSICKQLSCIGRHCGKNWPIISWAETRGPPCSWRLHALSEKSECPISSTELAPTKFLRFARPDGLTQWLWELRWKSPSSSSSGCMYLVILMEANGGMEEGLNLCDYSHRSMWRNSLHKHCEVRRGQMCSASLCQPEVLPGPTRQLGGKTLGLTAGTWPEVSCLCSLRLCDFDQL